MAFRTLGGPALIGTQRYGAGRNTGLIQTAQSATVNVATASSGNLLVLPAGAMILSVSALITTVYNGTTPALTLSINGTAITGAPFNGSVATAGQCLLTCAATTAAAALWQKAVAADGVSDATVTYAVSGTGVTAGISIVQIEYLVADPSGAQFPSAPGLSSTVPGP